MDWRKWRKPEPVVVVPEWVANEVEKSVMSEPAEPLAECCGKPWSEHLGVVGLCRELAELRERIANEPCDDMTQVEKRIWEVDLDRDTAETCGTCPPCRERARRGKA